jgi:hypothetical protein
MVNNASFSSGLPSLCFYFSTFSIILFLTAFGLVENLTIFCVEQKFLIGEEKVKISTVSILVECLLVEKPFVKRDD